MTFTRLCTAWNHFWYSPQSSEPVAAFRIAVGLLVLSLCLLLYPNVTVLFGPKAVVSLSTMSDWWDGTPQFSLFTCLPENDVTASLSFALLAVAGLTLTLGLCSRMSALAVFLLLLSLDSRNHFVFHPAFALMRTMSIYLSLSCCGHSFSVDNLLRRRLGRKDDCALPSVSGTWAVRLMQLQMVAVYWSALSFQLQSPDWFNGNAVYYATHLAEFRRFPVPFLFDQLWTCKLAGWFTILVESSLCTLIWIREFRYFVLVCGVILHLGIEYTLVFIPLLQYLMIASYLLFLDPSVLEAAGKRLKITLLRQ